MSIRMVRTDFEDRGGGRTSPGVAPRLYCDACDRAIEDAVAAIATWKTVSRPGVPLRAAPPSDVFVVHKGDCDAVLKRREEGPDQILSWIPLEDFLVHLVNASTPTGRHPEFGPLVERTELHPSFAQFRHEAPPASDGA